MDESDNIVQLQTVQVTPIRNTFNALRDMIPDLTIVFDNEYMRITNYDQSHTILVDVCIKFDGMHVCKVPKVMVCANASNLSKLICLAANNDVFSMFIPAPEHTNSVLSLGLQYDNAKIGQRSTYNLRLYDEDEGQLVVPDMVFDSVVVFTSMSFHKIIRDLSVCGTTHLRIESTGNEISFTPLSSAVNNISMATGRIVRQETGTDSSPSKSGITFKKRADPCHVYRGEFTMKSMTNLLKCSAMATNMEIRMRNGVPLIIRYVIGAGMGHFSVCISPVKA